MEDVSGSFSTQDFIRKRRIIATNITVGVSGKFQKIEKIVMTDTALYLILRISHYSKEQYGLASKSNKKNRTKIWHTFQMRAFPSIMVGSKEVSLDEIFNQPGFKYKQSISFPMSDKYFDYIKQNGWFPIKLEKAHWVNRSPRFESKRQGRKKRVRLGGYL